jgi:hypothetical protein
MKLVLFTLAVSFAMDIALACSCGVLEQEKAFKLAKIVFSGKFVSTEKIKLSGSLRGLEITIQKFNTSGVWKGSVDSGMYYWSNNDSCSTIFDLNKEYIIYSHSSDRMENRFTPELRAQLRKAGVDLSVKDFLASICSRVVEPAVDASLLGKPRSVR